MKYLHVIISSKKLNYNDFSDDLSKPNIERFTNIKNTLAKKEPLNLTH